MFLFFGACFCLLFFVVFFSFCLVLFLTEVVPFILPCLYSGQSTLARACPRQ